MKKLAMVAAAILVLIATATIVVSLGLVAEKDNPSTPVPATAEQHPLFMPVFPPGFGPSLCPRPIVSAPFAPVSTLPDAGPPWSLCGHRNRKDTRKRAWTIKLTRNETEPLLLI